MFEFSSSVVANFILLLACAAYFYGKNARKEPLSEMVKILILGTLSILPVLLFHQWFLRKIAIIIRDLWPALQNPFLSSTMELLFLFFFIVFFMGLFSILHSASLRVFYRLPFKQNFRTLYKRMYSLAPILIFFVIFLVVELIFNLGFKTSFVLSLAGSTIVFAILEEYFKYIINPFLVYKKINSINTAMVHAIYVGLAFAFVENVLFFYTSQFQPHFERIILYRSVFTTLLHIGASGLIGYFYGLSFFSRTMLTNYEIEKSRYPVPKWLRGIIKKTVAFESVSITQGFFLAASIHAIFNYLLYLNLPIAAAVVSSFLGLVVLLLLNSELVNTQYGIIGSQAMPTADFEKLRLQISVLEHVKEIQKERGETTKSH